MKIIFLDIDGVLNTDRYLKVLKKLNGGVSYYGMELNFDPRTMKNLKRIIVETDAYVVISSSWREGAEDLDENWVSIIQNFEEWELEDRIIGYTPIIGDATRGEEIKEWLKNQNENIEKFVIIDDNDNVDELADTNLVLCNSYDGITEEVKEKAIIILKGGGINE